MNKQRTFTIRLNEEEDLFLEKLRDELGISTDNGVIRYLVSNYSELNKRYMNEQSEKRKTERKLSELQGNMDEIKRVFKLILKEK